MMKKVYYETMLSYCLKCRKNTESRNPMVEKTKRGIFYHTVRFVVVKNQNLLKSKRVSKHDC